jgi:hypothetical protein
MAAWAANARAGDLPTPAEGPAGQPSTNLPRPADIGTTPDTTTLPGETLEGAQDPTGMGGSPSQPAATAAPVGMHGLSSWITYSHCDCCGPVGGDGPVTYELYTRTGPVFTFGDTILAKLLNSNVGWDFHIGGRTLFFDPGMDAAWTIDLSLSYDYNQSKNNPMVPLVVAAPSQNGIPNPSFVELVTLRNVSRTCVNATAGREWYINAPASAQGFKWRAGFDLGGRLGTAKANFAEVQHRTDTIYGVVGAVHVDVEKSCGCCCTFLAGLRLEYDYISMDILKELNHSNVEDINLLLTWGFRF